MRVLARWERNGKSGKLVQEAPSLCLLIQDGRVSRVALIGLPWLFTMLAVTGWTGLTLCQTCQGTGDRWVLGSGGDTERAQCLDCHGRGGVPAKSQSPEKASHV
jgi:hypothetical protein